MNLALNLLGLLLTAALVENPFYTRCFMAETVDAQLNERRDVMLRSIIAAGMCLPAAISGWLGRLIFTGYTDIPVYLSTPAGILLYIVIFLASNTTVCFFCFTSIGTISSLNLPSAIAFCAFCWLHAANSSSCSLVSPQSSAIFSAVIPI